MFAVSWLINAALLVAALVWIFGDGSSARTIDSVLRDFGLPASPLTVRDATRLGSGITLVKTAVVVSLCTLAVMFVSLFRGSPRLRSLRVWLLFTAAAGGWLGLVVGWPEIHWLGQKQRVAAALPAIAATAERLSAHWPRSDGESPEIGPFLAYPKGEPTALLPLRTAKFPGTELQFSAVEQSADGAIRFELSGSETGVWVELRLDDSEPQPFVGGLETLYQVARHQKIAPGWFLVRYRIGVGYPRTIEERLDVSPRRVSILEQTLRFGQVQAKPQGKI